MRNFPNIEKLQGRAYYTGYAPLSGVWHIRKAGRDSWYAVCQTGRACGVGAFYGRTLSDISDKLSSH